MGIMNKIATVKIRDIPVSQWAKHILTDDGTGRLYYTRLKAIYRQDFRLILECDGFVHRNPPGPRWEAIPVNSIFVTSEGYMVATVPTTVDSVEDFLSIYGDRLATIELADSVEEKIAYVMNLPFNSQTFSMYRNPTSTGTVTMTNNMITIKKDTSDGQIGVINKNIVTKGFFAVRARKLNDKRTILRLFRYDGLTSIGWSQIIYELSNEWNLYIFNDTPITRAEIQIWGSAAGAECEISDIFVIPSTIKTEEII